MDEMSNEPIWSALSLLRLAFSRLLRKSSSALGECRTVLKPIARCISGDSRKPGAPHRFKSIPSNPIQLLHLCFHNKFVNLQELILPKVWAYCGGKQVPSSVAGKVISIVCQSWEDRRQIGGKMLTFTRPFTWICRFCSSFCAHRGNWQFCRVWMLWFSRAASRYNSRKKELPYQIVDTCVLQGKLFKELFLFQANWQTQPVGLDWTIIVGCFQK